MTSWRSAVVEGPYRYRLDRRLRGSGEQAVVFVMLNPSTADEHRDDPTLRRCIGFASRWGFARLIVVNLFALRATDPEELNRSDIDVVGPENDEHIGRAIDEAEHDDWSIVCAWGAHPLAAARAARLAPTLTRRGPVFCLGETKSGAPKHPLYLPSWTVRTVYGFPVVASTA